jgi:hypothetical protein
VNHRHRAGMTGRQGRRDDAGMGRDGGAEVTAGEAPCHRQPGWGSPPNVHDRLGLATMTVAEALTFFRSYVLIGQRWSSDGGAAPGADLRPASLTNRKPTRPRSAPAPSQGHSLLTGQTEVRGGRTVFADSPRSVTGPCK